MIINQKSLLTHFVKQNLGNITSDMDGEKILLNVQKGKYYNLGETGGRIWDLVKQPNSVIQIVNKLLTEYDIEPSECEEQVISFLKLLLNEGLIQIEE